LIRSEQNPQEKLISFVKKNEKTHLTTDKMKNKKNIKKKQIEQNNFTPSNKISF